MKSAATANRAGSGDSEKQLKGLIDKFAPEHQALIRATRKALRKRLPLANELAYDNYNFFALGYCSTERPSDCIVSVAAGANGGGCLFIAAQRFRIRTGYCSVQGIKRLIRLESAETLSRPEVEASSALPSLRPRLPCRRAGGGRLIFRSVSAEQRPRRQLSEPSGFSRDE
jgi:hypothetical protein